MKTVWTENFILALVESQDGEIHEVVRLYVRQAISALANEHPEDRTVQRFIHHCRHPGVNLLLSRFVNEPKRFSMFDGAQAPEKPHDEA